MTEAPVEAMTGAELDAMIEELHTQMRADADALRFEDAARVRDRLQVLEAHKLALTLEPPRS